MEQQAGQVKAERRSAPDPPIERVRQRDQRPRHVVADDGGEIPGIRQRGVLDDQPVIVIDERIVEGVDVDEARQEPPRSRNRSRRGDEALELASGLPPEVLDMCVARVRTGIVYAGQIGSSDPACEFCTSRRTGPTLGRTAGFRVSRVRSCATSPMRVMQSRSVRQTRIRGIRGGRPRRRRNQTRVDLRVFPNRSNRLAYHWQCFTPAGMHRYLRDHAHEFDVAHIHACRNLPGALAAHYLDRYGVPYVLAPNGTAPVIERRRLAKRAFDLLAGTRMLRDAAAVIAVSDAERAQLSQLGVPDDRIHVVPNPVELSEFTPPIERGRFRRRAGFTTETLVTFLGKITPRKRLDVLVRAFAPLPGAPHLVIAGNDMGGLDAVRALASKPRRRTTVSTRPGCWRRAIASKCSPTRTSSCTRATTKCSGWCRSRRFSPARPSSSRTTPAVER